MKDGQNSVRKVVDTAGAVVASYDYDAWGNILGQDQPSGWIFNHRAFGEIQDPNLGMTYLRARWMDPGIARLSSRDAWGGLATRPRGLHRYAYANNQPIDLRDPSGLSAVSEALTSSSLQSLVGQVQATTGLSIPEGAPPGDDPSAKILGVGGALSAGRGAVAGGFTGCLEVLRFGAGQFAAFTAVGVAVAAGSGTAGVSADIGLYGGRVWWDRRDVPAPKPADYEGLSYAVTFTARVVPKVLNLGPTVTAFYSPNGNKMTDVLSYGYYAGIGANTGKGVQFGGAAARYAQMEGTCAEALLEIAPSLPWDSLPSIDPESFLQKYSEYVKDHLSFCSTGNCDLDPCRLNVSLPGLTPM